MGERFGIQPSTFRSRIFRKVEEDRLPLGPTPFQGLIQILHPFKAHRIPFYNHQTSSNAHSPGAMLSLAQRQTQAAATRQNPPTT